MLQAKLSQENENLLDIERFSSTPLTTEPFSYVIVPKFISSEIASAILNDYPEIKKPGSFSLTSLKYGSMFKKLVEELEGDEFRHAVEKKFDIDLTGKPTLVTVRGTCTSKHDGKIHTDTESKVISLLLYMNTDWENEGGRLRLLRNGKDIDNVIVEIPPAFGTLLVFKRSDNSWHGHKPFTGSRKVVQMNWVVSKKSVSRNTARHKLSSIIKKLKPFDNY